MQTATTIAQLRTMVSCARKSGSKIGFVPTMGALHEGHISLVHEAKKHCDFVVVSIFVNPMQFGPNEDFHRYPRPLQDDLKLCTNAGVNLVFNPSVDEMYPTGFSTVVEVNGLTNNLCGKSRPGHFKGVTTVVMKLFGQVQPDAAYFGQKDAQQALVIKRMACDLDLPIEVVICPTLRETDGLAMSSRNRYLSNEQRSVAPLIYKGLSLLMEEVKFKKHEFVEQYRRDLLKRLEAIPNSMVDYVEIVNADSLETLEKMKGTVLVAVALRLGNTRLIDNIIINTSA
ncbi:MAG: pantoate--beta-alanine ligase [Planctomycetes bacterium]|nr:pantoate--beta-alanine ligase [Planctomycetota bacterium]